MKLIRILFSIILILLLLSVLYIHLNITLTPKVAMPHKSDVIIVLGYQVWGKTPSWSLEYRLEKALELYNKGYSSNIIVSGGQGIDEDASEASVMKNWLVERGVPKGSILEEDKSTSTYENLSFSKAIMDSMALRTALIVTNDFHLYRSLRLAKLLSINASGGAAPTVAHLKLYYHCREIASVVKSYILYR